MYDQYLARRYRTTVRPRVEDYKIKDNVAIVGIGQTEFSKDSGRSECQMASDAIKAARPELLWRMRLGWRGFLRHDPACGHSDSLRCGQLRRLLPGYE